jgi:hypothetical protein
VSQLELPGEVIGRTWYSAGTVAVSDSRIFYTVQETNLDGGEGALTVAALAYGANGELSELGSTPPIDGYYYGGMVARDNRAFLSGYGLLNVVESPDGAEPTSREHEIRSWSCSYGDLEVVGDQAFCAGNEFGVQRIALD